ncbi:MAG: glutathione synthase [Thermodesulfobacteriota bacterium]|nr:glutathione synthase [Thermodesulfobacteriota bacterium]
MILSFHPCFSGDRYINRGGRDLNQSDIDAIRSASAVILPQGCRQDLYEAATRYCAHVFPNFDTRFKYPGKTGQIELFHKTGTAQPQSWIYRNTDEFQQQAAIERPAPTKNRPLVVKFDWRDEGRGVFLAEDQTTLATILTDAQKAEHTGQSGFVIQEYIAAHWVLRVVVIYQDFIAYWRVGDAEKDFRINLSRGAAIDRNAYPALQEKGIDAVKAFCRQTGINLAGFDLLFSSMDKAGIALFLEINYYFGRTGIGGSAAYYELLTKAVNQWLNDIGNKHQSILQHGAE